MRLYRMRHTGNRESDCPASAARRRGPGDFVRTKSILAYPQQGEGCRCRGKGAASGKATRRSFRASPRRPAAASGDTATSPEPFAGARRRERRRSEGDPQGVFERSRSGPRRPEAAGRRPQGRPGKAEGRAARPEHVSVKANGAQGRAEGKERSDAQAACRRSPHALAWACSSRTRSITG